MDKHFLPIEQDTYIRFPSVKMYIVVNKKELYFEGVNGTSSIILTDEQMKKIISDFEHITIYPSSLD
jgi:hypothetical protein